MNHTGNSDGGPDQPGLAEATRSSAQAEGTDPVRWAIYVLAQYLSTHREKPWSISLEADGVSLTIWQDVDDSAPQVRESEQRPQVCEDEDPMGSGIRQAFLEYDLDRDQDRG